MAGPGEVKRFSHSRIDQCPAILAGDQLKLADLGPAGGELHRRVVVERNIQRRRGTRRITGRELFQRQAARRIDRVTASRDHHAIRGGEVTEFKSETGLQRGQFQHDGGKFGDVDIKRTRARRRIITAGDLDAPDLDRALVENKRQLIHLPQGPPRRQLSGQVRAFGEPAGGLTHVQTQKRLDLTGSKTGVQRHRAGKIQPGPQRVHHRAGGITGLHAEIGSKLRQGGTVVANLIHRDFERVDDRRLFRPIGTIDFIAEAAVSDRHFADLELQRL